MSTATTNHSPGVPRSSDDGFQDGLVDPVQRSLLGTLEALLNALWFYTLGLLFGLTSAVAGGAASGAVFGSVMSVLFDTGLFIADHFGAAASSITPSVRSSVIMHALTAGASFGAVLSFCVGCLRLFPNKGPLQSLIVLESVALVGVFAIAGDARNTHDYTFMFAGLGVLVAIALLVLKFPHWVELTRR